MKWNSVGGRGFWRKQMPLLVERQQETKGILITVNGYHPTGGWRGNMADFQRIDNMYIKL